MSDINKYPGGKNMGGVNALEYSFASSIDSMPQQNKIVLTGPVIFKPTFSWQKFYFSTGTCFYKIQSSDTENGPLHEIQIQANLPKLTPVIESMLESLAENNKIIVRFWDNNRYCRIAGVKENPLSIEFDSSTGKSNAEKNGTDFLIKGSFIQRIPYYYQPGVVDFPNSEDGSVL